MNEDEQFFLETYRRLDRIKADIKERLTELEGDEPDEAALALMCWHVWRLTNFHCDAWRVCHGEDREDRATVAPPEISGERTERLLAMDARLQEVLGDAVDVDEEADDLDDEDAVAFRPEADEQVMMVEYGDIIREHRWFIDALSKLRIGEGDHGIVQNIVVKDMWGFEVLRRSMLRAVMAPQSVLEVS